MERASGICHHTSHGRFAHFHRTAACQRCVFLHIQRFRTKRCTRFRGQALCIQRRHAKRSIRRFYRRAASFCDQGADRQVCLCFDFRIACRSRERVCVYTAAGRNSKRACFCFGERDIVICIDGRALLCAEFLEGELSLGGDLHVSFFRSEIATRKGRIFAVRVGEVTAGGKGTVFDGSFIRDAHRSRLCGIAAIGERARVGDVHRRAGHRCFSHCRISVSVIRERTACGKSSVLDGLVVRDAHRPCFCGVCPRRQLAAVGDGHRTSLCGIGAVFDGSFIREGDRTAGQRDIFHDTVFAVVIDRSSAARNCRILNRCGIRDGECLCPLYLRAAEIRLVNKGGICAYEGAASDGAIIRIIDVEGFSCLVAALRDLAVVGDGGIFCLDGSLIRCRFSEEGDVGVACRLETDAARRHTAVFGFFAGHFHAERLSFALAFDICHVFDGNIRTFHIRVGGAHFLICIMAVFGKEAVALEVKYHVPIGGVDGVDDEVAVFRKRDTFLCAGSEGAAFLDGDAGDLTFAGFKNDLVLRTHGDIVEVARPLHAELAAGEEFTAVLHAGIAGEVDGAILCFRGEFPVRIRLNGADRADGDFVATIYFEIPALCGRKGDQLVCRQALDLLFRREVDHLSVFLASDAAHVLAIFRFTAKCCQGDILSRDMRGFLLRGLGIGDALFDAATREGDEEILCGFCRADEDFCLFFCGEVLIRCQIFLGERGIAVERLVRAFLDPLHIRFDVRFLPSADGLSELVIACLFVCDVLIDVGDAIFRKCRLRGVVQSVRPVLHVSRKGLILIVLALYFGDEEGFLFRDRRLAAFQDPRLRPGVELCLRIFIRHIGEIVVDEAAVCRQNDIAMLRGDAVEIEIAAGIRDSDISICAGFETIGLAAPLLRLDRECAGCTADGTAACIEVHAACRERLSRCLRDAVLGSDISDLARRYRPQGDIPFDIDGEVAACAAGDGVCAGLDRLPRAADASGRSHMKASGIDIAEVALRKAAARECRSAAAIGERAIDEDVMAAAIDRERAAIFRAAKADAHIVVRLEGILGHLRIIRGLDQFVIEFLRKSQRIPETFLFFREYRGRLCCRELLVRRHVCTVRLRPIDLVVAGDEGTALQRADSALREVGHGTAPRQHFCARRSLVIDPPPVKAGVMQFIGGRGTAVLSRLHGIVRALRRLIFRVFGIREGGDRRIPCRSSIRISLDALPDHPILSGVGGLSCDFPARAIQIRDLDLSFDPAARREGLELDVLVRVILHLDRTVAVEGFDAGFVCVIGRIEDSTDDGDVSAVDFHIADDEAVIRPVIGYPLDLLPCFVRDEDLRAGWHRRCIRHIDLRAAIHVEELVLPRDGDRVIRNAALDLGIDIHIARGNEDIAICQNAVAELPIRLAVLIDIVQTARVIERIPADAGNAGPRSRAARIIGLDEIPVRYGHIHAARVDRALIVHVAIRTRDGDRAARIVDIALEIDTRCGVVRRMVAVHIRLRTEIVLDGDRRPAGLVARLGRKGNVLPRVLVLFLDRRPDRLCAVPFDLGAVEINRTALAGACRALAADDVDISHHQMIRRIIRDLHFRIAARLERARAGDIVPFEDDIPELRGDIAHEEIMRHLLVDLSVEEVVFLAVLHDLAAFDFIAIGIEELAALLRAIIAEEILCQLDLGIDPFVVVDADLLFRLLLLLLCGQFILLRLDVRLTVLRRIFRDRIAVGGVVAVDCTGVCRFGATLCRFRTRHGRSRFRSILAGLLVGEDVALRRICLHIFIQSLTRCLRQCFHCRLRRFFCGPGGSERTLGIGCRLGRTVIRRLARCDSRQAIDLTLRLLDLFLIGRLYRRQLLIRLLLHFLGIVQLRGAGERRLYEATTLVEIPEALCRHLLLKEFDLRFIRGLRRGVGRIVDELLLQLVELVIELRAGRLRAAIGVREVAIARDLGRPCPILIRPTDGHGFLAMDARLRLAVHGDIGGFYDLLLPDLTAVRAEGAFDGIHPVLHLAGARGGYRARLRLEEDVPVALHIRAIRDGEARPAVCFRVGILLDGDRDRRRIQDVAVRADADRACLARAVTACRKGNIPLRRFRFPAKGGICLARVGDVIFRTGVARQAEDIDQRRAVEIRIISCADGDRTALVRAIIRGAFRLSFPALVLLVRLLCLAGFEACAVRDSRARFRIHRERLLHVRCTDGGTGRQGIVIMRFDAARGVDGDGFLVVQGLARGLFFCRKLRSARLQGDFPEIGLRGMGDLRHTHDAIPGVERRTTRSGILLFRAVFPRLFTHIVRADGRLPIRRHGRTVTDGDLRSGVHGVPRIRPGAAVSAGRDRLDLIVSSVFMICGDLRAACLDLDILPDRGLGGILHSDPYDRHGSGDDAAASGNGMRIGIVIIPRLIHHRAGDELIRGRERCPVSDGDTRGIFGVDLCHGRSHAADADAR